MSINYIQDNSAVNRNDKLFWNFENNFEEFGKEVANNNYLSSELMMRNSEFKASK